MTPEQRGELKAAAFAATPGPWEATRQTDDECNFVGYFIEAPNKTISDDGTAPDANDALYIAAANPSAILSLIAQVEALTVPQGWKLVPEVPTEEMLHSATKDEGPEMPAFVRDCYIAMLNAAPTIPAIPGTKEGA